MSLHRWCQERSRMRLSLVPLMFVVGLTPLPGQVLGQALKLTDPGTAVVIKFEEPLSGVGVSSF